VAVSGSIAKETERGKRPALRIVCINESNEEAKGEAVVQRTDLADGSTGRVTAEPQVRKGYSRLETAAQGTLLVLRGGLLMALVVMSALVFGL
jgi:hypothetical protein